MRPNSHGRDSQLRWPAQNTGWHEPRAFISQSQSLEAQDQGISLLGSREGLSSWLADGCRLALSSHRLLSMQAQRETVSISLPPPVLFDGDSTLLTSCTFNHLLKAPIDKRRHILSYKSGLQNMNFGGDTIQPQMPVFPWLSGWWSPSQY